MAEAARTRGGCWAGLGVDRTVGNGEGEPRGGTGVGGGALGDPARARPAETETRTTESRMRVFRTRRNPTIPAGTGGDSCGAAPA